MNTGNKQNILISPSLADLQTSEIRYRRLFESSRDGILILDAVTRKITDVNPFMIELLGYTREEFLGKELWEIGLLKDEEESLAAFRELQMKHYIRYENLPLITKAGERREVEFISNVHTENERQVIQCNIRDITAAKGLEKQLRQAQKLESVGLLAGGIAHDFNNMLTAINGYSDMTLRQLKPDDPIRRNIEEIRKAGQRSADLTHQLLAFSRQQVLRPVVLDVNEIIADTTKMLERLIGENIQLVKMLNPAVGRVMFDPGQFTQIITNLVVNARDAMPRGGKLIIETINVFVDAALTRHDADVVPGAYVLLAVSDNGSGMSDEVKQHIFEPFFTMKAVGQATGLGLATVYGIVKQSGGSIEVFSQEAVGTTFKIYLPCVAEQIDAAKIINAFTEMPGGTETILLVEDEELVRNLSREILKECGYTVIEARNGLEALTICDKGECKVDLLMTDVVMPQMGGLMLAKKLIEKLPNVPILFTSGYTDDAVVRRGVIEADTNFIQKPFTPAALASKIREILDTSYKKVKSE